MKMKMKRINHICFITNGYPSAVEPFKYNFLDQLVLEVADLGIWCTVIHPVSLIRYFGRMMPPSYLKLNSKQGHIVEVFRPRYLSFSARHLPGVNTASWTLRTFMAAAKWSLDKNHLKPDALYGHFIYPSGVAISLLSRKLDLPAFCAIGEGEPWSINMLGPQQTRQVTRGSLNLFAVSAKAKRMLVKFGIGQEEDIPVIPNGVNLDTFHQMDRKALREEYGFPQDGFIVAFIGSLIEGKGFFKLMEAIRGIQGLYTIIIGSGSSETDPESTLFKGQIQHDEVPRMLNCADIFVLPTLIEGCSNAIIEALACGLPIVSSNYEFNEAILNDACSIRIDPLNVGEIRQAILTLMQDHDLRERMSQAALQKASQLDLHKRAQTILDWMESKMPSPLAVVNQE